MKKTLLTIAVIATLFLVPTAVSAQVFSQSQIIIPSYGNGVIVSTSTANGGKLQASSSPSVSSIYATSVVATSSIAHLSVGQLAIGSLTGILKAVGGYVQTSLVNLASDVTGTLGLSNGGTGTSTPPTYGKVYVGDANGNLEYVATSSLGILSGVSSFNTRTGAVTLSSGDVTTALGYTPSSFAYPFPANATTSALSLGGLTVTNLGAGTVNANSSGTLYTSGTTTASCSGSVSCSTFAIFGSSPITISGSGAINALSTTSPWTIGSLAYVVDNSHVSSVATSTLTAGSGLTGSFTQVSTGGSVGCATANTSTFGCLTSTDWNTFNTKSSFAYPFALSGNATSTLTQFNSGLTAYASSTIGNGSATGGLTINGGATTTGDVIFYPNGQSRGGFVVDYNNPAIISPNVSHPDSITVLGDDNDFPAYYLYAWHFRALDECYSADGTEANPTNTKSGSELCRFGGRGYDGTAYTGTASAVSLFAASSDWSTSNQGAWVAIRTTPIGSTGGGSQQIPPITAAFTASGGLIVGSTTAAGGGQFTYSPSNFAFYATDPGNGNILANGITTVNATTTNATTTTLTLLGTTGCNTGNALTTNALGNVVCGTTGSGSGTVSSGTTGQFPYYASSGTTLTATSSLFLAASGNVGIGNTAPLFPLHVSSNGSATIGQIALTDTNAVSSAATWLLSSQGGVFSIGTTTAAGATTTPSAISINNAGNMAIDTTINTNTALNVGYTFTTGAGLKQALSAGSTYTGSNANAQVVSGSYTSTFQGTVNNTSVGAAAIGGRFNAVNNTTGLNALNIYGVFSTVTNNGAFSSTTNAVEFFGSPPTAPAGTTITNSYGMRISGNATEAGSIVNGAGVDVDNLFTIATNTTEVLLGTNTIPSGRFAIYQSDSNNNYFAGNLGIGTTSPYQLLSVAGNEVVTGTVTWPALATPAGSFLAVNPLGQVIATTTPSGSGAVSSVSNSDSTLTISPTTGNVIASLNLTNPNTWTGLQQFGNATTTVLTSARNFLSLGGSDFTLLGTTTSQSSAGAFPKLFAIDTVNNRSASPAKGMDAAIMGVGAAGNSGAGLTGIGVLGYVEDVNTSADNGARGLEGYLHTTSASVPAGSSAAIYGLVDGSSASTQYALETLGGINYIQNSLGVGTSSPFGMLAVSGTGSATLPLFSVSSTTTGFNFRIDASGHIVTSGPKPTISACGTTNNISGNDVNGTIMFTGTLVASCTMTLGTVVPAGQVIDCQATSGGSGAFAYIISTSTTAVVFGLNTGLSADSITYDCPRHQ